MHWAYRTAQELIEKHPNQDIFVCASGISPSGSVHIGNFREVVTTYFVVRALQDLGKKTRFIFSWDDYDRFRKVPKNIDQSFEQYIGMPYSEIPDPYGCHSSYAAHFEKEFEEALGIFGIDVEFIYQSKEYTSGRYNYHILHALKGRKEIYDILMAFKTQESSEEERNHFYPITLYCERCRKDNTEVKAFDEMQEEIQFVCSCGHHGTVKVMDANNIKLNWKVDWPMRWMVERVVFEPGGRDHSSETGSYNVSKEIVRRIFNHRAPDYVAYEFIGIKGNSGKMSSSLGNIITPGELLKIYLPEIILFIFSRYKPNAAFNIGLDEDVIRNYSEYERFYESYRNDTLGNEDLYDSFRLLAFTNNQRVPSFSQAAGILPLINFDVHILGDVLRKIGEEYALEDIMKISDRVEHWMKHWYPEKMLHLNQEKDMEYYEQLKDIEKRWLRDLCAVIQESEALSSDELMKRIYAVCHDEDHKVKKNNQKTLFGIVYKLVLDNTSGPRLSILIKTLGIEKALSLLDFSS
ncbi:lysyl-tRNA synthetase class 1 [Anaerosolibacter carboniphilus]|uniref:Lysine--tRNA ligase n=1 Tax=Anaerosolibacter carboniphilus TaxID=1417629 RepID=A0A841L4Z2_9FIRM|nr:lysine--tRNA ligase [Anaerosolibacter carboniphilus]MBB6217479.1 lysyl-tRNA synthetase class 1 [Anaerosolibacter carboniphilus]